MTRLPQLERDLIEAAARRRHRRRLPRLVRPALALAAVAGAILLVGSLGAGNADPEREVGGPAELQRVPAETFAKSERLVRAGAPDRSARVAHEDLPAAAAVLESQTPYPPGRRDDFDWNVTPKDPLDMGAINAPADVQALVEYRAGCLWLRYWADAHAAGHTGAQADALVILRQSRDWPTSRGRPAYRDDIIAAAARGDAEPVHREIAGSCDDRPRDPADGYEPAPPEQGHAYGAKPRTLLRIGDEYAVVGYELEARGGEPMVCLDLHVLSEGTSSGCHSGTERVQGTAGGMRTQRAVGATLRDVDIVHVRYRLGEVEDVVSAKLGRATDEAALEPLDLAPFTFYVAELPTRAVPFEATAFEDGVEVWRARFPNAP